MNYFITGGAGFIGSHVVDHLLQDNKNNVIIYDNFSTGKELFIQRHRSNPRCKVVKADLKDTTLLIKSMKDADFIFHLAAHADVRSGFENHTIDHTQNLEMTQNVLEAMFKTNVKKIAFSSTSSVYGDAKIHPTPEDYPLKPTSLYGASKAAAESYICAYTSYYNMQAFIFRFVSFIGPRYTHGIIYDILKRLQSNNKSIELFSDGTPKKSSLYIDDGISAMMAIIRKAKHHYNVYNIGHANVMTVNQIVDTVLEASGKPHIKKHWLGKESNWKGDNEYVKLDISKLSRLGWYPKTTIKDGIKQTVDYLSRNQELIK